MYREIAGTDGRVRAIPGVRDGRVRATKVRLYSVSYDKVHSIALTGESPLGMPKNAPPGSLHKRLNIWEIVQIPTPKP